MPHRLIDFIDRISCASSVEDVGKQLIAFMKNSGIEVVHTYFGIEMDCQSVSTLPEWCVEMDVHEALTQRMPAVEAVRAGMPRVLWGIDFPDLQPETTVASTRFAQRRLDHFNQRSSVVFAMPNAGGLFEGGGVGLGADMPGEAFLAFLAERGGMLSVAANAAYTRMLSLRLRADDCAKRPSPLSPRQEQILQRLAGGRKLGEIADELGISDSAVALYLANLRKKLKVRTKEEALALSILQGWIKT